MELELDRLRELAKEAIQYWDEDEYIDAICNAIHEDVLQYIQHIVKEDGIPESGSGWQINDIELLLVEREKGCYVPSVRSDYWDATAGTWDIEIHDPIEALTMGLTDALAEQLKAELTEEE